MKNNAKKKLAKRDKMLIVCVFAILSYTIASFVLQFCTSVEISSTLTVSYYGFWTVEIWQLSKIKRNKDNIENKKSNNDDESDGEL